MEKIDIAGAALIIDYTGVVGCFINVAMLHWHCVLELEMYVKEGFPILLWRKIMTISFRIDFPNSEETKWYWIQMVVLPMLYCTAEMQIGLVTLEFTYQILAMALQLLDGAF